MLIVLFLFWKRIRTGAGPRREKGVNASKSALHGVLYVQAHVNRSIFLFRRK